MFVSPASPVTAYASGTSITVRAHSRRQEGHYVGAEEATEGTIVVCSDGKKALAMEVSSSGRYHSASSTIKFLDRKNRPVTYQQWLTLWAPALATVLGPNDKPVISSIPSTSHAPGNPVQACDIGLDIQVSTSGRIASGSYRLKMWTVKDGRLHTVFGLWGNKGPAYRLSWCDQTQKVKLEKLQMSSALPVGLK